MWYIHPDGLQLECGYFPVNCMESTSIAIAEMLRFTTNSLKQDGFTLSNTTSQTITPELANTVPLGCRPSFNAHDIDNNITNKNPLRRFAGGHFHFTVLSSLRQREEWHKDKLYYLDPTDIEVFNNTFSLTNIGEENQRSNFNTIIKIMDATMGMWSTAFAHGYDDPERRQYHYGMAGDYRLTNKTVEYRVPSNVVWQNSVSWHIMGMMGRYIVNNWFGVYNNRLKQFYSSIKDWGTITDIINNTDGEAARKWWEENENSIQNFFYHDSILFTYWGKVNSLAYQGPNIIDPKFKNWDTPFGCTYPTTLTKIII